MGGHRFNPEKADLLVDPKREETLSPTKMAELLELKPGEIIADLGAGNGFFAIPFARKTKEKLVAIDIEPLMLEKLKERAREAGIKNIEYKVSSLENLQLEGGTFDKILTALVLHEVSDLQGVLSSIHKALKPNGKALIIEWEKVETDSGPPLQERISSEEMVEIVQKLPFNTTVHKLNDAQYGVLLEKI